MNQLLKIKILIVDKIIGTSKFLVEKHSQLIRPFLLLANPFISIKLRSYKLVYNPSLVGSFTTLIPEQKTETAQPKRINGSQNITKHSVPAIGFIKLTDAVIDPHSSVVRVKNMAYVQSTASMNHRGSVRYRGRQIHTNGADVVLFQETEVEYLERGIMLCGSSISNWYHLLVEILSKLELVDKLPEAISHYPLLLPDDVLEIATMKDLVQRLTEGREVIYLQKHIRYQVASCIYIDAPILSYHVVEGDLAISPVEEHIRPELLTRFKERIMSKFTVDELKQRNNEPTKVFLARGENAYRQYNQADVFSIFEKFGFRLVYCDKLSLIEQVRLFSHAECVAGPSGAAWTNILFCKPNAKALCFMPDIANKNAAVYSNIAHVLSIDLRYYFEPSGFVNWTDTYDPSELFKYNIDVFSGVATQLFDEKHATSGISV
ncbi:MAG: glycosyltransferase family 61 protein [Flavobacteriales bacterium]|nr:glycosyltransferase family 61 protein [Flavobacteriales bacterium]